MFNILYVICMFSVSKFVLFLLCHCFGRYSSSVRTLALDHRNDVLSNIVAIICGYLGKVCGKNTSCSTHLTFFSCACFSLPWLSLQILYVTLQGFFLVFSGTEFRLLSQWNLGDFFPILKKNPNLEKKKTIFFFFRIHSVIKFTS